MAPSFDTVLTPEALDFVAGLARRFAPTVSRLLAARQEAQAKLDAGKPLNFMPDAAEIRQSDWTVAPLPAGLQHRRVEITGPVDRKMIINALNSDSSCFMADFEDTCSSTRENMMRGHINLSDAVAGTISFDDPASGSHYSLGDKTAVLLVRPRGWYLWEPHVRLDGAAVPGGLFDFGLYFFRNARLLLDTGARPV